MADLWNESRKQNCNTEKEFSDLINVYLNQWGLRGPAFAEQLLAGIVVNKYAARAKYLTENLEKRKISLFDLEEFYLNFEKLEEQNE